VCVCVCVCVCVYILTGHKSVVCQLLEAGSDLSVTVGGQTAVDMARAFEQTETLNLLTTSVESSTLHWPDDCDDGSFSNRCHPHNFCESTAE